MTDLFDSPAFEPTLAAAQARLAAVRPAAYARTRNHLDGAVTRLSPYLTHGLLTLPDVLRSVLQRGELPVQHKLVFELAWREYFAHVWLHLGDGILQSLHPGVLPDAAYSAELPADIRQARTGVPAIDCAVRTLYATGYLHNHARMWLASYVVHLRKVHWRAGADWLYGHLLDGDLASNHLSWQWVAGTGSHKPYLFNAENVARYAPPAWHSSGTVIDTDYDTLDQLARHGAAARDPRPSADGADGATPEPALLHAPPQGLFQAPDAAAIRGRVVVLVHPWSLGVPDEAPADALRVGIADTEFHAQWPWSPLRWEFVGARLREACDVLWLGPAAEIASALAGAVALHGTQNAHLSAHRPAPLAAHSAASLANLPLAPLQRLLAWPDRHCASFSQFWTRATRGLHSAGELPGLR